MSIISEKINYITIVKLDHVGDVILSTPAIESIRNGFPNARLRIVVGSWSKEVLANNPNVDEVICYDPPWLNRGLPAWSTKDGQKNKDTMKYLLEIQHDLVVDLRRNDFNHISFSSSLSGKYLIAYKTKSEFDHLITHGVSVTSKEHVIEQQIKLLKCLGLKCGKLPKMYPQYEDEIWADIRCPSPKPKIAIFTGAGAPIKKWPEEKFTKLGKRLNNQGFKLIIVGGELEKKFGERMTNSINAINLCGQTTLLQLTAVLKRVHVLISNDSAPVHIATSVGTPVAVLTKPNAKMEFAPAGDGNVTISRNRCEWKFDCPGFVFNHKSSFPKKCRCINSISVEEVERAVYKIVLSLI